MTTYRRLELPSLADDLDEVLIPRDTGDGWNFVREPAEPGRPASPPPTCFNCGRLLSSEALLWGHRDGCPFPRRRRGLRGSV